jgi:hypothetical protein
MEDTYTYIARNADDPARAVTFTLHDHSVSVGLGAPLEHVERALEPEGEVRPQLWLKPLAVSLLERSTRPFHVTDVDARAVDDWLRVTAWLCAGGLRLAPISLTRGRVDNPEAASAFVEELNRRKESMSGPPAVLGILDYWATWFLVSLLMISLLGIWRRRRLSEST